MGGLACEQIQTDADKRRPEVRKMLGIVGRYRVARWKSDDLPQRCNQEGVQLRQRIRQEPALRNGLLVPNLLLHLLAVYYLLLSGYILLLLHSNGSLPAKNRVSRRQSLRNRDPLPNSDIHVLLSSARVLLTLESRNRQVLSLQKLRRATTKLHAPAKCVDHRWALNQLHFGRRDKTCPGRFIGDVLTLVHADSVDENLRQHCGFCSANKGDNLEHTLLYDYAVHNHRHIWKLLYDLRPLNQTSEATRRHTRRLHSGIDPVDGFGYYWFIHILVLGYVWCRRLGWLQLKSKCRVTLGLLHRRDLPHECDFPKPPYFSHVN